MNPAHAIIQRMLVNLITGLEGEVGAEVPELGIGFFFDRKNIDLNREAVAVCHEIKLAEHQAEEAAKVPPAKPVKQAAE